MPASEVAEQAGLPLSEVRLALRKLAAADRAKHDIAGKRGNGTLAEPGLPPGFTRVS